MKSVLKWLYSKPKVSDQFGVTIRTVFQAFMKLKGKI